jgi:hypothetical protein
MSRSFLDDPSRVLEERPLGADRGAELLELVMVVRRDRGDLGVGDGDLAIGRGQVEVLLMLLRAEVPARECEDERIVPLDLAELSRHAVLVRQLVVRERAAGCDV